MRSSRDPSKTPWWFHLVAYLFVVAVVWLAAMLVALTGYWFGVTFSCVFRFLTGGAS